MDKKQVKEVYLKTKSYSSTARFFGVSRQRIHQIITNYTNTGRSHRQGKYRIKFFFNKCYVCGLPPKVLHHIDGNNKNDSMDNLQALCYSCHKMKHKIGLL